MAFSFSSAIGLGEVCQPSSVFLLRTRTAACIQMVQSHHQNPDHQQDSEHNQQRLILATHFKVQVTLHSTIICKHASTPSSRNHVIRQKTKQNTVTTTGKTLELNLSLILQSAQIAYVWTIPALYQYYKSCTGATININPDSLNSTKFTANIKHGNHLTK